MINHFLTIVKVGKELFANCIGCQISDLVTFRKNEFLIQFSNGKQFSIFLLPSKPFVFVSGHDSVPLKNVFHFFPQIRNKKLKNVLIHQNDRILKLMVEDDFELIIQLFSASSGVSLFEKGLHLDSLKIAVQAVSDNDFVPVSESINIEKTLSFLPVASQQIPPRDHILADLENTHRYFCYTISDKRYIFPFKLRETEPDEVLQNGSLELKYWILNKLNAETFTREKKETEKRLLSKLEKAEGTIKQLEHYLSVSKETLLIERDANLLYSQPDLTLKGLKSISVLNIFSDEAEQIQIKLNPDFTFLENANQLYAKLKNFKEVVSEKTFLLNKKKSESELLKSLLEKLQSVENSSELKKFKKQFIADGTDRTQSNEISEPFHRIRSQFGYEILIGKHAKGNDFLLSKVARKNDIWFHCKGNSGSHVIIPNPNKEMLPKNKLEEAAAFAAFFSGQKKSDWVPVSYTFCKYVRKIKGSAPGAVVVDREDILFVKPIKPNSN